MLITFKSQASGDVMMFGDVATSMMKIIGKENTPKGIITVEDLPAAIDRLNAAIAEDRHTRKSVADGDQGPAITIAQRALPLVELLDGSLKRDVPVVWGI